MNIKIVKKIIFSLSLFCINFPNSEEFQSKHMIKVFNDPALKIEFSKFIDNVLKQTASNEFYRFLEEIIETRQPNSDIELYELILKNINQIKPRFQFYYQLKALQNQKNIIGNQLLQLAKDSFLLCKNYVEIGTPGIYFSTLRNYFKNIDKIYVINDKQRLTDKFQAYSLNPLKKFNVYSDFVELNDYEKISENKISSNSVDIVVCTIGLHHIPKEKLNDFISSINRILRVNGIFILREHDGISDDLNSIIHCAHSVYNALMTQESVESEKNEYRNFNKLEYWINLLEKNGFKADSQKILQKGDPTLNTLMKFIKVPVNLNEKIDSISYDLKTNSSDYQKDLIQTYLSGPEWVNVDASKEYSDFIEHTPFYEFPYMKNVQAFWKVFVNSYKTALKKSNHISLLTSSYMLMNLFIGVTMTIEYGAKSLISLPIAMMYSGQEAQFIEAIIQDPLNEIANIDSRVKIKKEYSDNIKHVQIPRYMEFLKILKKIENSQIIFNEIAGQKFIQFKIKYKKDLIFEFNKILGTTKEYEWDLPTQPNHFYAVLNVEVNKLRYVLSTLRKANIEIIYIHDF